ncbi:MAG: LLM class flavin-dependent oxidoreductase [Candidatus Binataceae bacterium]
MHLGVTIPLDGFLNHHVIELARHAEKLGFTDAWSSETYQTDAFSPLATAAAVTQRLRLGTAIVPVFTRPAALIAMSAAAVQQASNGRFVLGLGITTPTIATQWMGVEYKLPLTRMRETVAALRMAFSQQKMSLKGRTMEVNGFRLDPPIENPPPIYVGAQGEKMLRLAGELGDGVVVNFITPETFPKMLAHIKEGAKAAGRPADNLDVACRIVVAVDQEHEIVREELRRELTAYLTVPQYNKFFREIGYESEATVALDAWNRGDRKKALQSVPDYMIDAIFVSGPPEHWIKRLRDYEKAGITTSAFKFNSYAKTPEEKRARIMTAMEALAVAW